MRRKRICRGSFPKGLCLRGVAGPFPPVGILLLEALPGAAPLHICSSPRALNPAFQTPGAREESGGGKIAAFRDEIPPSLPQPAPSRTPDRPGSAGQRSARSESVGGAAPGTRFGSARGSGSSRRALPAGRIHPPFQRVPAELPGCAGRTSREQHGAAGASAVQGTGRSGLEKRSCQEGQGKSKSARQGEGSDQRAPEAARQRWERGSSCLPGNGWMESGCLCGNHTDPRVSHPRRAPGGDQGPSHPAADNGLIAFSAPSAPHQAPD